MSVIVIVKVKAEEKEKWRRMTSRGAVHCVTSRALV
jgi:hypothetical protein